MNDRDQGLSYAREEERIRYAQAKRTEAFERNARARENALVAPRCDHLATDAPLGADPGVDNTGFCDGLV